MKPLNLPADLIKDWARRQTLASAKLEGRELPEGYIRPLGVQEFLDRRAQREAEAADASWVIYDAV